MSINAQEVVAFAQRLGSAGNRIDPEAERLQQTWGERLAAEMRSTVSVRTGALRDSIRQVGPGEITYLEYGRFLERGTSHMPPEPFVRPAVVRIRPQMFIDVAQRIARLI